MTTVRVTASVTYDYDLDGGIVATEEDAVDDALSILSTGQVSLNEYDITVTSSAGADDTSTPAYSRHQVTTALNRACDDVCEEAELPEDGVRDALNLLVNATIHYLDDPDATLAEAAEQAYGLGSGSLDEVVGWIGRA